MDAKCFLYAAGSVVLSLFLWATPGSSACSTIIGSACIPTESDIQLGLQNIPAYVDTVILSKSNLNTFDPSNVCTLPKLIKLELSDNLLLEIPKLSDCIQLKELSISGNSIVSLEPSKLEGLLNLTTLRLDKNKIRGSLGPDTFPYLPKLRILDLTKNEISSLQPKAFSKLPALEEITLDKNRIRSLPGTLFSISEGESLLKRLSLGRNKFSQVIPSYFSDLPNLEVLDLSKNKIQSIGDAAIHLQKLVTLSLAGNKLSIFRLSSFSKLNSLQNLDLSANTIERVKSDENLLWHQALPSLKLLNLSHNSFTVILNSTFGAAIRSLTVRTLLLNNNNVEVVEPGALLFMPDLSKLDISQNRLSGNALESLLTPQLMKLKRLSASGNMIRSLHPDMFSSALGLRQLDVSHNPITAVANGTFSQLVDLQHIDMNSAELHCDCSLGWLVQWARSRGFVMSLLRHLKCGSPALLTGEALWKLDTEDLVCISEISVTPVLLEGITQPLTSLINSTIELSCKAATSDSQPLIGSWSLNGRTTSSKFDSMNITTTFIEKEGISHVINKTDQYFVWSTTLLIPTLGKDNSGEYACTFTNDYGSITSRHQITPLVPPTFVLRPIDVHTQVGGEAHFTCASAGFPMPEISWGKRDSTDSVPTLEFRAATVGNSSTVVVKDVSASDQGVYICHASNEAGTVTANATLTVTRPPAVKRVACPLGRSGKSAHIYCEVVGSPRPFVKWLHDNRELPTSLVVSPENGKGVNISFDQHLPKYSVSWQTAGLLYQHVLVVSQVSSTDAGEYMCSTTNNLGRAVAACQLEVERRVEGVAGDDGNAYNINNAFPGLPSEDHNRGMISNVPQGSAHENTEQELWTPANIAIVTAVTLVAVGTAIVWVIILCQMRRKKKERSETVGNGREETRQTSLENGGEENRRTSVVRSQSAVCSSVDDPNLPEGSVLKAFKESRKVFGEPGDYRTAAIFPSDTDFKEESQSPPTDGYTFADDTTWPVREGYYYCATNTLQVPTNKNSYLHRHNGKFRTLPHMGPTAAACVPKISQLDSLNCYEGDSSQQLSSSVRDTSGSSCSKCAVSSASLLTSTQAASAEVNRSQELIPAPYWCGSDTGVHSDVYFTKLSADRDPRTLLDQLDQSEDEEELVVSPDEYTPFCLPRPTAESAL